MTGSPPTLSFRHSDLGLVITDALSHLVLDGRRGSDHGTSTLLFSGEGASAEAALRDALDDIHEQCVAHSCMLVGVRTERTLRTDTGVRIWGTLSCLDAASQPEPRSTGRITIDQEGGLWTLTITTP